MGIVISQYKDPYMNWSVWWNVTGGFCTMLKCVRVLRFHIFKSNKNTGIAWKTLRIEKFMILHKCCLNIDFWDDEFIVPYYFSIYIISYLLYQSFDALTSSLVAVRLMMIRSIILFFLSVCLQSAQTSLVPWLVDFPITNRASNVGSTTKGRGPVNYGENVILSKIIQEKYRRKT